MTVFSLILHFRQFDWRQLADSVGGTRFTLLACSLTPTERECDGRVHLKIDELSADAIDHNSILSNDASLIMLVFSNRKTRCVRPLRLGNDSTAVAAEAVAMAMPPAMENLPPPPPPLTASLTVDKDDGQAKDWAMVERITLHQNLLLLLGALLHFYSAEDRQADGSRTRGQNERARLEETKKVASHYGDGCSSLTVVHTSFNDTTRE